MGEMKWNSNYPDPSGLIKTLHDEHFHLMVSIWPYFRPGSKEYETMDKNGWFIAKTQVGGFHPVGQALYDPTNPEARKYYWDNANTALFKNGAPNGVDAWCWTRTSRRPRAAPKHPHRPSTPSRQRSALRQHLSQLPHRRRGRRPTCGFGQETGLYPLAFCVCRIAAQRITAWSGDVLSDFVTFQRQISAGLNYAISGMP